MTKTAAEQNREKAQAIRDAQEAKSDDAVRLILGALDLMVATKMLDADRVQADLVELYTDAEWEPIETMLGKKFSPVSRRMTARKFRQQVEFRALMARERALTEDDLFNV
jgi:hypothetical protein